MKKTVSIFLVAVLLITSVFAANIDAKDHLNQLTNYFKTNQKELHIAEQLLSFAQEGYLFDKELIIHPDFPDTDEYTDPAKKIGFCYKLCVKSIVLGKDPKSLISNVDPVKLIVDSQDPLTGLFDNNPRQQWMYIVVLEALNASYDREKAIEYMVGSQAADGGWCPFVGDGYSFLDPDTSAGYAIVLSRFKDFDGVPAALTKYFDTFVKGTVMLDDGSIGEYGESSSSTFTTICALIDNGKDVFGTEYKGIANNIPLFKRADGSYYMSYTEDPNADYDWFSTKDAILALTAVKNGKSAFAELLDNGVFAAQAAARQKILDDKALQDKLAKEQAEKDRLEKEAALKKAQNPPTGEK